MLREDPGGQVSVLAGGTAGYQDGALADARFRFPTRLQRRSDDALVVADPGNRRIRLVQGGVVSTLAGSTVTGDCNPTDGPAGDAVICELRGIAVSPEGAVFFSDASTGRIAVVKGGRVSTLVTDASLDPAGIALDAAGSLWVADRAGGLIRQYLPNGTAQATLVTPCRTPEVTTSDACGPIDVAVQGGDVFILFQGAGLVRRASGNPLQLETTAGVAFAHGYADGRPAQAQLANPGALSALPQGGFAIADTGNGRIRLLLLTP